MTVRFDRGLLLPSQRPRRPGGRDQERPHPVVVHELVEHVRVGHEGMEARVGIAGRADESTRSPQRRVGDITEPGRWWAASLERIDRARELDVKPAADLIRGRSQDNTRSASPIQVSPDSSKSNATAQRLSVTASTCIDARGPTMDASSQ